MLKKITLILTAFLINSITLMGNGVGIIDSENPTLLKLLSSSVFVNVENQVAVITARQTFKNDFSSDTEFTYAFPLPEGASAVNLRWYKHGIWKNATIAAEPQDTVLPGGGGGEVSYTLKEYLGPYPLYFEFADALQSDSLIIIELKYVQLLGYEFGKVSFTYPNNYLSIQSAPIDEQILQFSLTSSRTITDIQLLSHSSQTITNEGTNAGINLRVDDSPADRDYDVEYSLSTDEFGLFGFSTMLPDSLVYDKEEGTGFFTFVAEPNPADGTEIINKVFTLIIDKSGSMGGAKIEQAKSAAEFIVNNLNEGDKFNIVSFSSGVSTFQNSHVINNVENRDAALAYISNLYAQGSTNISNALKTSISQFSSADETTANIIIFFTDGEATTGTTDTDGILDLVNAEIKSSETEVSIFTFGIGAGANRQLLTLMAEYNNGLSEFLGNDELQEVITQFYLKIRNPVLLDTEVGFSSDSINEIYPNPLQNLYKGQQVLVSGRYSVAEETIITLSGSAFGKPIEYNYTLNLADTAVAEYQFLPKIWAKQKIEYLMVRYYSMDPYSAEAEVVKEQILTLSIAYGIITEFTSFSGEVTEVEEENQSIDQNPTVNNFKILGNYPNPFNPSTRIRFSVGSDLYETVIIKIYNSIGQLVRILAVNVSGAGIYEVTWDGLMQSGETASSDVYIYTVEFGNTILASKMMLVK